MVCRIPLKLAEWQIGNMTHRLDDVSLKAAELWACALPPISAVAREVTADAQGLGFVCQEAPVLEGEPVRSRPKEDNPARRWGRRCI